TQRRRRRVELLLDVRSFARREVPPLVRMIRRHTDGGDTGDAFRLVDDRLRPGLLVRLRDGEGRLDHRCYIVVDVLRNLSELKIRLLGDRARLGDFDGDARDAPNLVLGDDRTRGKPPHAAVHDPNAETRCLAVRVGRYLANLISSSASAATAKTTAAPAPP